MDKVINFWCDFFAAYNNRLKKFQGDSELDVILHVSFIISINVNTILITLFWLFNVNFVKAIYLIVVTVLVFGFIYYYYNFRLDNKAKQELKIRKPKYNAIFYRVYGLFSAILLLVIAYILGNFGNVSN